MVVEIKRYIKIEWKIKKNRMEDALEVKKRMVKMEMRGIGPRTSRMLTSLKMLAIQI